MDLHHSNYLAAFFCAAATFTQEGAQEQKALGKTAENMIKLANSTWTGAKYQLGPGQSFNEIPLSFQSWMSVKQMRSMLAKEYLYVRGQVSAIQASINRDIHSVNSCISALQEYGSTTASGNSNGIRNALNEWRSALSNAENRLNVFHPLTNALGGNPLDYTSAQVKSAFLALTNGLAKQQISRGNLPDINASYLNHKVTGSVTVSQLTNHVASLVTEGASAATVQDAQAELGRAQTWLQGQTSVAKVGVENAQTALSNESNLTAQALGTLQTLITQLHVSEQELKK